MTDYSFLHNSNIVLHVVAGSVALILGVFALLSSKGGIWHRKTGKLFLRFLLFVILTGLIGVFVFERNTFLLIITILSAYYGFSGFRVLKNKSNSPKLLDISVGIIALASVSYFLYYFQSLGMYWSPVIIYSTVGALVIVVVYDFSRFRIPSKKYRNLWLYEHIFKMIGAFTALLSAFTGTVFENFQPYSQFLPSVFGTLLQIVFIIYYVRLYKRKSNPKKQKTS